MPKHHNHKLNERELRRIRRLQRYYRNDYNSQVSYTFRGYNGNACNNNNINYVAPASFYEREYFDLFDTAIYK